MSSEIIPVSQQIELRSVEERYTTDLHNLVIKNKIFLQTAFDWAQHVGSEEDTRRNVQSNQMLHQRGYAKMFLIFHDDALAGVLSFNAIEPANKTGYIGYWLDEAHQGKGILSRSLQAFMRHYVELGTVRRFVIKCRVDNHSSNAVALRNGFMLEGCLREAEYLNGRYDDVNTYARLFPL
ncbi:50S ribosomal protein L7/L12-serine acetyltransferase [Enterobacter mori]|jgi:ribosomal-protein-serine acetyltransferase|uniref:50S ribosomal protein L7/L12-serine acetyltransferase n=1 Tax=Enterobacter TaxID=547 RepID=UPI000349BBB6|nr:MULTISPECIES: 50S ribosomal protein L7/L12-serine acetyltransferase [Enterobacter]CAF3129924.1 Ribosomal-protein-serine acetyltransferase [Enterobacter cloacae]MBA7752931.1 50S ribosomal protein L7/L12-serine acetyltransferase [Enterobacter sp. RHBSTW-01064]MBT1868578.1 50S ribosomal protein L7/L12-serine acetyltransferase [Enterobacter mori]MBW8245747.1 50S ribosomal protein L7/L12-serine acetyltransferase [Enterobacter mori]MBW8252165.1 50S ribosomal protein L7/L12-serine acetyltransferas